MDSTRGRKSLSRWSRSAVRKRRRTSSWPRASTGLNAWFLPSANKRLSLLSRLRHLSAPLADDTLPLADGQGGLAPAVFHRHLEARPALIVDFDEVHHAPARSLFRYQ